MAGVEACTTGKISNVFKQMQQRVKLLFSFLILFSTDCLVLKQLWKPFSLFYALFADLMALQATPLAHLFASLVFILHFLYCVQSLESCTDECSEDSVGVQCLACEHFNLWCGVEPLIFQLDAYASEQQRPEETRKLF